MCLHSVKADEKQIESTANGALDPWSCFENNVKNENLDALGALVNI